MVLLQFGKMIDTKCFSNNAENIAFCNSKPLGIISYIPDISGRRKKFFKCQANEQRNGMLE